MSSSGRYGVRIIGAGAAAPSRVLDNRELETMMDTTDEWIVRRTGIRRRHIIDPPHESAFSLARDALRQAMVRAGVRGEELDLIIHASVTSEMACPSNACRIGHAVGAGRAAAFDLLAACSGFTYGMSIAETLIRSGRFRTVGVIGCDALSTVSDFTERTVSILFGDGAGATILTRDDDPTVGAIHVNLGADGSRWEHLYMPRCDRDVPEWDRANVIRLGCLRMAGREVFKFAVVKLRELIATALEETGLTVDQISQFVCHQSNLRIIEAAKERLRLPDEKVLINIDEYGNTSSGSVGLVFEELWREGRIKRGEYVLFVAIGGGMTWACSVWKM